MTFLIFLRRPPCDLHTGIGFCVPIGFLLRFCLAWLGRLLRVTVRVGMFAVFTVSQCMQEVSTLIIGL